MFLAPPIHNDRRSEENRKTKCSPNIIYVCILREHFERWTDEKIGLYKYIYEKRREKERERERERER